jgi:aspartate/methionine/tyrosine aminotransferase
MKFTKSIKGRPPEKYPLTCGYGEPCLDTFTDVKRALHRFLLENNHEYQHNSESMRLRNAKQKTNA